MKTTKNWGCVCLAGNKTINFNTGQVFFLIIQNVKVLTRQNTKTQETRFLVFLFSFFSVFLSFVDFGQNRNIGVASAVFVKIVCKVYLLADLPRQKKNGN